MKSNLILFILYLLFLSVGFTNSCKKDPSDLPSNFVGTRSSFTEEFENVDQEFKPKGWVITDNTKETDNDTYASWGHGANDTVPKSTIWQGFSAYSYSVSNREFAYSSLPVTWYNEISSISSWLITPVLSVKNGDKISFYTRGDTISNTFRNRMQVLMNKSSSADVGKTKTSVGGFTTFLFDINQSQAPGGYPMVWTKYEYTFTGISGYMDTRIAFRHYTNNATPTAGVGIDLFKFEVH
jgi:hypothetical protein